MLLLACILGTGRYSSSSISVPKSLVVPSAHERSIKSHAWALNSNLASVFWALILLLFQSSACSDMIDIAKSAVCSFLTCNDRYDWSVYTVCFSPPIYILHYYHVNWDKYHATHAMQHVARINIIVLIGQCFKKEKWKSTILEVNFWSRVTLI